MRSFLLSVCLSVCARTQAHPLLAATKNTARRIILWRMFIWVGKCTLHRERSRGLNVGESAVEQIQFERKGSHVFITVLQEKQL